MNLIKLFPLILIFSIFSFSTKAEHPEVAEFLSEYVQIPSVTGEEKEAAHFLADYLRDEGFEVKMLHDDPGSHNVAASLYPLGEGKPNVVFLSHIDVVPISEDGMWRYPAFSGAIEEGKVWGRGAIDNKGMTAMQLFAMKEFMNDNDEELPFNVTLLAVSNEEKGGALGAGRVVDDYLELLNPAVMLGEGGVGIQGLIGSYPDKVGYGVSIAQKRGLWLKLRAETKAAGHGSVPPDVYSNTQMIEALSRIKNRRQRIQFTPPVEIMFHEMGRIEGGVRGFFLRNITALRPFLSSTLKRDELLRSIVTNTITFSDISNPPTSPNQIPQWTTATLDCRLLPGTSTEKFIAELQKHLEGTDVEIEIIKETSPSMYTTPDELYYMLRESILENDPNGEVLPILFPANNDNNYFRARGIPVYGILPSEITMSQLESIHNVNERIEMRGLVNGTKIYKVFLKKLQEDPPEQFGIY